MFKRKAKKEKGISDVTEETRVAIDIGHYSIKLAYFKDNLLCLDEFPFFEQPKDIIDLKQQQFLDIQMSTINKAVSMINPKAEFILSPQPSPLMLTRVLQQPPDLALNRLLERELPFEPDQFTFDTQEMGTRAQDKKSKKSEKRSLSIAVAASNLDFIQRCIGLLGEFQLQIKSVTPKVVGLLNYLLLNSDGNGDRPVVFLDLGALFSHLIIFKGKEQFLARTIHLGGIHFNNELVKRLNVDFETAEKIKTERKLIDDSLFDSKGMTSSLPMFQAINSILFNLVDEIKNSMTYFEDYFLEDLSNAIVLLAGGSSNLQNLDRFLTKETDLPVSKAEKALHDLTPDLEFSPQFASTVGLLRKPTRTDLFEINLINNIEGMLFKLEDGDYYLTKDGFVDKKKYKRKQKTGPKEVKIAGGQGLGDITLSPLALIKELPQRIKGLLKGEKFEMPTISFSQMDFSPIKSQLKNIFVVIGALFLVIYGGNRLFWAPKMRTLDHTISSYLSKSVELDQARSSVITVSTTDKEKTSTQAIKVMRTDKILWADKLKAIAAAIPEMVWVSDLAMKGNALVISCHVYSYGQDHLKTIALFIKNIKTRKEFLNDFEEVKFQSALRNTTDKDIYDFTLTFPLKREMIEQVEETIVKAKG